MTALIGDATDFTRGLGLATGGPSPSHHVGSNSAVAPTLSVMSQLSLSVRTLCDPT